MWFDEKGVNKLCFVCFVCLCFSIPNVMVNDVAFCTLSGIRNSEAGFPNDIFSRHLLCVCGCVFFLDFSSWECLVLSWVLCVCRLILLYVINF